MTYEPLLMPDLSSFKQNKVGPLTYSCLNCWTTDVLEMENYDRAKSIGLHSNLFLGSDLYMKAENNALDSMFFYVR